MSKEIDLMIEGRMLKCAEFTFSTLYIGLPDGAYRVADRKLQSFRRRGFASFIRRGRHCVWSLTDAGRAHLSPSPAHKAGE